MPIVYNNKNIRDIYYGSTRIRQVYLGSKLIWERLRDLYSWGNNSNGQLGLGSTTYRSTPAHVGAVENCASVACWYGHTLAINTAGELYSWGWNQYGQLGLGNYGAGTDRISPTRVGTATNWAHVSCGYGHTLAINTSGALYSWGYNDYGQLGLGDATRRTTPTRVGTATNWSSVSCGNHHSMAINTAGELYSWGLNNLGYLGLGDTGTGTDRNTPTRVGASTNWAAVSCGGSHTLAINTSGELYSWGSNSNGQLGLGESGAGNYRSTPTRVGSATNWASVACGDSHTLAINTAGELYAWGYNNYYGMLGLGDTNNRTTPTRVGTATDWASVACGNAHTLAINTAGELYSWGWNNNGQLGLGSSGPVDYRSVPTRVGTAADWASVSCGNNYSTGIRV